MDSTAFWKCHCQFNSMSILISFLFFYLFHILKAIIKQHMKLTRLTIGLFIFVNFMFHNFSCTVWVSNTKPTQLLSATLLPAITPNWSCARIYKVLDKIFILQSISEAAYGTENHKYILHFSVYTVIWFSCCKWCNTSPM